MFETLPPPPAAPEKKGESPKSVASPKLAIVMKSIVLVCVGPACPCLMIPLVLLEVPSGIEVTPVKSINEVQFNPGNVCRLLIEKYTKLTLS